LQKSLFIPDIYQKMMTIISKSIEFLSWEKIHQNYAPNSLKWERSFFRVNPTNNAQKSKTNHSLAVFNIAK